MATLASLLRDTPALAAQLRAEAHAEPQPQGQGHGQRQRQGQGQGQGEGQGQGQGQRTERGREWPLSQEALDAAAAQLPERFVQSQPAAARPFARLLCETSAFRVYLEAP